MACSRFIVAGVRPSGNYGPHAEVDVRKRHARATWERDTRVPQDMLRGAADLDVEVHCWEQNLIHLTSSNEKVANAVQLTDNGKERWVATVCQMVRIIGGIIDSGSECYSWNQL